MGLIDRLLGYFDDLTNWVCDLAIDFTEAFVGILPGLPGVDLMVDLSRSVPEEAYYAMYLTQFGFGFSVYLTALVARFLVRRIPFIG